MGDGVLPWAAGGFIPGSLIAGYRLEEQIGRGGMAVVFRAHDERLNRQVALKILAPALAADVAFRHRFIRESQAAAAVDDPNIIPVFEADDADGVLFIAMRLVRGGDVKSLVATGGPLPVAQTRWIISAMASALDTAHAAGLVHRDVKPANMLLEIRGGRPHHVYLSDFGLSKAAVATSGLTGSGQFLGTVDYSAPEQIQGTAVDGRTDQYALGCTALELLTGEPPFPRDHGLATLLAHLSEPPPSAASRREGLPASVDHVFSKVLAKKPEDRYSTCQEFADELGLALAAPGAVAGEPAHLSNRFDAAVHADPISAQLGPAAGAAGAAGPDAVALLERGERRRKDYSAPSGPPSGPLSEPPSDAVGALTQLVPDLAAGTTNLRALPKDISNPEAASTGVDATMVVPGEPDRPPQTMRPYRRGRGTERRSRRKALIAAVSAVALAGAAAGVLLSRTPTASPSGATASEVFPAQRFYDAVTAARQWTLGGHAGSVLTETITLSNPTGTAQLVSLDEPIPAAIAPMLVLADFTPQPVRYLSAGRVAQWKLSVPAHSRVVVGYRVTVPAQGATKARLRLWAAGLASPAVARPATGSGSVSSLGIRPHHLRLTVGSTARLTISGLLKNGRSATAADLAAVVWVSSDPAVASVNRFGKVSAHSAGTTHVTARLGTVTAASWVVVASGPTPGAGGATYSQPATGPANPPPPPPTHKPTSSPSPSPTTSASCPPYCPLIEPRTQSR